MPKEKNSLVEKDIDIHVVAVMGFIKRGNKFLLAKRHSHDPQAGGMWSIPGGKVDLELGDKIIEKTLKKEIYEEVGIKIKDDIVLLGNDAFLRVSGHHVIALTFLCSWKSGVAKPLEDQEEIRWLTISELKNFKELPDYTERRVKELEKYLNRRTP